MAAKKPRKAGKSGKASGTRGKKSRGKSAATGEAPTGGDRTNDEGKRGKKKGRKKTKPQSRNKKNGSPIASMREALAKALTHSLRVDCLAILNEREASPTEISKELGVPLSNVNYHIEELLKYGMIVEVATVQVRGATEHRYRAIHRAIIPAEVWDRLSEDEKIAVDAGILRELWVDITASIEKGDFDRSDSHLSITPMVVDMRGRNEAKAVCDDALNRLLEIEDEATERLKVNGTEKRVWTVGIAGFDSIRDPEYGLRDQRESGGHKHRPQKGARGKPGKKQPKDKKGK